MKINFKLKAVDFTSLERLKSFKTKASPQQKKNLLDEYTKVYLQAQVARFNLLSSGGGGTGAWKPLSKTTIKRKAKVKAHGRVVRGPYARLIDTMTLMNAIRPQVYPGQVRKLDVNKLNVELGIGGHARHPLNKRRTIGRIAAFHHFGMGRNPVRTVLAAPSKHLMNKLDVITLKWLDKVLRGAKK